MLALGGGHGHDGLSQAAAHGLWGRAGAEGAAGPPHPLVGVMAQHPLMEEGLMRRCEMPRKDWLHATEMCWVQSSQQQVPRARSPQFLGLQGDKAGIISDSMIPISRSTGGKADVTPQGSIQCPWQGKKRPCHPSLHPCTVLES